MFRPIVTSETTGDATINDSDATCDASRQPVCEVSMCDASRQLDCEQPMCDVKASESNCDAKENSSASLLACTVPLFKPELSRHVTTTTPKQEDEHSNFKKLADISKHLLAADQGWIEKSLVVEMSQNFDRKRLDEEISSLKLASDMVSYFRFYLRLHDRAEG